MKRRTVVDEMMAEVIIYGGLPVRRYDVYRDALKRARTRIGDDNGGRPITEKDCRKVADMFAFSFNTRLAPANSTPLSREELEQLP